MPSNIPGREKVTKARWYKANRERLRAKHRLRFNANKVGISLEEFTALFNKQKGVCAICGNPETHLSNAGLTKRLSIDHCHATGVVRGLLCDNCNHAIGHVKENVRVLKEMILYIESADTGLRMGIYQPPFTADELIEELSSC